MKLWAPSTELSPKAEVGGKGHNLQKLTSWGANVPPFIVLTTDCYRAFVKGKKIPEEVRTRLKEFLSVHPQIALRSSMVGEDQVDASFAGMFETILDVTSGNWEESLIKIYDSVAAPRVKEYLDRKKLNLELMMAVVAQAQVNVEKSGVLFTRSPVNPTAVMAIDAAFGMGEGVVSGHAQVDHYQFTRAGELVLQVKNNEGPVLTAEEQKELLALGVQLEKRAGYASDIEWGRYQGRLYVFQIRPITRDFEPLKYFVDTNLSESYPGTVSPFTAKFVQQAYHHVFRESAQIMGATGKRLATLDAHYAKLISHVDDHLYYNLEHYYAVLRALPGGEKNIDNWHRMIGGKIDPESIPHHRTELSTVETLGALGTLGILAWNHDKVMGDLLKNLEGLREAIMQDISRLSRSEDTIDYLNFLIEKPMGFGLTVVNDVFIMMGLGFLTKALKSKGVREDLVIDLLKTSEGVDSVKPLELFNQLVGQLSTGFVAELEKRASGPGFDPWKPILSELSPRYLEESKRVEEFLALYGDRSFEELKLESLPLRNNPALFVQLVKWAQANPSRTHEHRRSEVTVPLSWLEEKVLVFTRKAIAAREATRLWRGKFYQLLRILVLDLGERLQREDARWKEFSVIDFFSLRHDEWVAYRNGKLFLDEAQTRIRERRPWQKKRQQYPEIIQWVGSERLPTLDVSGDSAAIQGQGVSPGIAEGIALVLENPTDALSSELENFILVTKNTDPAWVYIMSRSQGLISEKGSLLSHTAIIGRELGVPTIVGVRGATTKIKTGDRLRMDAGTGAIEVL